MRNFLATCITLVFLVPGLVHAETVLRTGDSVSITNDRGVVGDFYGAGNVVTVSGVIEGDFVSVSGRTTHNGQVSGDLSAIGVSVDVHGPVGDDVRVVAGNTIIADVVGGDVVVVGGTVDILSTATVTGDVILYAGQAEIAGAVEGNVFGSVGELRIDGVVSGDVDIRTRRLTLGDDAEINGSVLYRSENLVERSPNAIVGGELLRNDSIYETDVKSNPVRAYTMFGLVLLFSVLLWQLLSRRSLHHVASTALEYSPKPLLVGLGVFILTPIVIVVLLTSMLGAMVGVILLLAYLLFVMLSATAVVSLIGLAAYKALNQVDKRTTVGQLLLGTILTVALSLVPVVGPLILMVAFLVTFGALVDSVRAQFT